MSSLKDDCLVQNTKLDVTAAVVATAATTAAMSVILFRTNGDGMFGTAATCHRRGVVRNR